MIGHRVSAAGHQASIIECRVSISDPRASSVDRQEPTAVRWSLAAGVNHYRLLSPVVNAKFFQEDLVEDVELTAHTGVDESKEPICLSKGNEVEEVDPHEIKGSIGRRTDIDVGQVSGEDSNEEEEYTSDECEDDDEDGAELDISYGAWSTIGLQFWEEDEQWEGFLCGIKLGSVYTSSSYSRNFWSFFCASSSDIMLGSVYTSSSYSSRYVYLNL
ncbi:hypothetical protein Taro_043105 [Colocasia esculenta]|uniref:Uncharacterized protein n=1 Tax=Colocasia esculenta TaxID=4460 RepID=A0A843WUQ6_COLES|nr:hypothetical protein [Colocasia esculenta]